MVNCTYGAPNCKSTGGQETEVPPCMSWRSRPSPGPAKSSCSLTPMFKAKKADGNSNSAANLGRKEEQGRSLFSRCVVMPRTIVLSPCYTQPSAFGECHCLCEHWMKRKSLFILIFLSRYVVMLRMLFLETCRSEVSVAKHDGNKGCFQHLKTKVSQGKNENYYWSFVPFIYFTRK